MNTRVKYKDITFGLEKHPNTNQPLTVSDNNAIRSSLKNLVMMNHYDKPFHPEIGSGVSVSYTHLTLPTIYSV